MTLLTWLLRKMGYVLVPVRQYKELENARDTCKFYFEMQDRNKMRHEIEIESIKASYKDWNKRESDMKSYHERTVRMLQKDFESSLQLRVEAIKKLRAEVDRLQALVDESTKKYL